MRELPGGASGTPRTVTLGARCALFFKPPLMWAGLIFFFAGSFFVVLLGAHTDFTSPFYFSDSDPMVTGMLLAKTHSNVSINEQEVFEYRYRYQVASQTYEGRSFTFDSAAGAGDTVRIQYAPARPALSRLRGQRNAPVSWRAFALTLIFPGVGLGILCFTIGRFRTRLRLVQSGVLATGKVIRKVATESSINGQTVFDVFFEFTTPDGRSHRASVACVDTGELGSGTRTALLYDAADPSGAMLLAALPAAIRRCVMSAV